MASVVTRVELSDKEIRDALLGIAKQHAGADNGGGASIRISGEAINGDRIDSLKNVSAVVEFQRGPAK